MAGFLYRQSQICAGLGLELPRATMADWVGLPGADLNSKRRRLSVTSRHGESAIGDVCADYGVDGASGQADDGAVLGKTEKALYRADCSGD